MTISSRSQWERPRAELAVEGAQPCRERLGLRTAAELLRRSARDRGVPSRIEPDVRVGLAAGAARAGRRRAPTCESIASSRAGWKPRRGRGRGRPSAIVRDVAAGELEVVRLDARRGQVAHVDRRAADLLGGERERVEGGDDGPSRLRRARAAAAAGEPASSVRVRTILVFTAAR